MTVIEKLDNDEFDLSGFTTVQILFIKGLVKLSYDDGVKNGITEIKNQLETALYGDPTF